MADQEDGSHSRRKWGEDPHHGVGSEVPEGGRTADVIPLPVTPQPQTLGPQIARSGGRQLGTLEHIEALVSLGMTEDEQEREQRLMAVAYEKAVQGMPKQGRHQTVPEEATKQMAHAHRKRLDHPSTRATHRLREYRVQTNIPVGNATFTPAPREGQDKEKR